MFMGWGKINIRTLLWCYLSFGASQLAAAQSRYSDVPLHKTVYRIVNLEEKDTGIHMLADEQPDSTMSDMIIEDVRNGMLVAYTTSSFTDSLDAAGVNICLDQWHDTALMAETADSAEVVMRITVSKYTDGRTNTIKIAEDWTFDERTGTTNVVITGVAPQRNKFAPGANSNKCTDMFWVKYKDLKKIKARYESYHPGNNLPIQVWRDYFEREIKPKSK